MSIHCLLVLPVPVTTLNHITTLIRNFVWNSGDSKRRHWIGWERLCVAKDCGGLGIRNIHSIKLALQGKRAWIFLEGKTLWARFARSRFTNGNKGSPNWRAIAHIIEHMQQNLAWQFGNGDTTIEEICFKLGVEAPYYLKREKLRDLIQNLGQLGSLIAAVPQRAKDCFRNVHISNDLDRIYFKLAIDGVFSTKVFYDSFQSKIPKLGWAKVIWHKWIPPKPAYFLWKVFHNIVVTDSTIQHIGIPLASRCVCCPSSQIEDSDHLLFQSSWAQAIWRKLADAFDRPLIHSKAAFYRIWLRVQDKNFMDAFAAGVASSAVWEIWKCRNSLIYDNKKTDIWCAVGRWAKVVFNNIQLNYVPSWQNDLILTYWGIHLPNGRPDHPPWTTWRPPDRGYSFNVTLQTIQGNLYGAGLVREGNGRVLLAFRKAIPPSSPLVELMFLLDKIKEDHPHLFSSIWYCHSSCSVFHMLDNSSVNIPHDCRHLVRRLRSLHPMTYKHIQIAQNGAVLALVYSMPNGSHNPRDFSPALKLAISADSLGFPNTSVHHSSITRDDSHLPRIGLYRITRSTDDRNIRYF